MILADFHLPRRLRPVVAAAARVVCPDDLEALGLTGRVTVMFEHALRSYPAVIRASLVAGLATLEASAVVRHGRPFSRLPRETARAFYDRWWHSPLLPISQFARALKTIFALAYYDSPAVKARIGYDPGPWIAERIAARLSRYGADVERAAEDVLAPDPLLLVPRRRHA